MRLKIFALSLVFVASPLVRADDDELMDLMGKQVITDESTGEDAKAVAPSMIKKLLPKPTAEQNIFVGFFSAGDFEKALYQWPSAFEGSTFAKTANGQALSAYLLFKNGTPVYALERLLSTVAEPQKLDEGVKKLWLEIAPSDNPAWARVWAGEVANAAVAQVV